jgi:membrane protein implicated in regulation of membrane protease activity
MLDWLNSNIAYWHWIVFGLMLSLSEILVMSFVLLWFGLGAIVVGILLWLFPLSFTLQLLIWVSLSLFNVFGWFKWISPRLKTKSLSGMAREKMIGQIGTVIEYNAVHSGRGKLRFPAPVLGNDEWQFICEDEIEVGSRVMVQEFSGNSLIVNKFK